ncbi:S-layer homology domain-containing protein [Candidatus Peregrinibacteria bacterium]|nr:S-layer homology domain-containing protein [Candidatus Peregrinibacteria bacterium]
MYKTLVSKIAILATIALMIPVNAFAADIPATLITSVILSVADSTPDRFEPSAGQSLATAVVFSTSASDTTGSVKVKQGSTVVETLASWTNTTVPTSITAWNGRTIDSTGEGICGAAGAVCPNGNYTVEVAISAPFGSDTLVDTETANFTIFTTPAVEISSLASPATFNPITETGDISFSLSATGFITVDILDGGTVIRTLVSNQSLSAGTHNKTDVSALAWNGKNDSNNIVDNKAYTVRVRSKTTAEGSFVDTKTTIITVAAPSTLVLTTFTATTTSGDATFDPAPLAGNEDLTINYTFNKAPNTFTGEIISPENVIVDTFSTAAITGENIWDGLHQNKLVAPGAYTVKITASVTGESAITQTKTITIAYPDERKGDITNITATPESFDPDLEDTTIRFVNTEDTNLTVEIVNADNAVIRSFENFSNQNFDADTNNTTSWNGRNSSTSVVGTGIYKAVFIARNDYGAVKREKNITVIDIGTTIPTSNAHISGISFSPSSTFEPADDDELEIKFDVLTDLDSLKIFAVKGTEKITLFDENDIEEEDNLVEVWDGTDGGDEDDHVMDGTWRIRFESAVGGTTLFAEKTIAVKYIKPEISDLILSKNKFDNEENEFTSIMFRVDEEANVQVQILKNGEAEEDLVEDMQVEADIWYSVDWDGGGFDYEDNIDVKLVAENIINANIFDSQKVSADLAEDKVTGERSNILNDFIAPAVTDGTVEMDLHYFIDEEADVVVTIHRGESASGGTVTELVDLKNVDSGDHDILWNGKDDSGRKLAKGIYSYKIVATRSGTDTEKGVFIVGDTGSDTSGSSSSSNDDDGAQQSGTVNPNVIINGERQSDDSGTDTVSDSAYCAGFTDLSAGFQNCDAIEFVKERGIFTGNADGSFRPFSPINRAEILKVILEALDINVVSTVVGNLGFIDVIPGEWYMKYIKAALDAGIFQGDAGKNTARPESPVNRAEALKMLFETLRETNGYVIRDCSFTYGDTPQSAWYHKYVCESKNYGLFDVTGDAFGPASYASRMEMAELFYRLEQAGLL